MMQRICPICDKTMKSAHYCSNCRSWIKQPWMREITYYLNERHPENESGCSYHGSDSYDTNAAGSVPKLFSVGKKTPDPAFPKQLAPKPLDPKTLAPKPFVTRQTQAPAQRGGKTTAVPNRPRANPSGASGAFTTSGSPGASGTGNRGGKKAGTHKILIAVVIIYILIQVLAMMMVTFRSVIYSYSDSGGKQEYDIDLGNYREEYAESTEEELDYRELEDEAVIALGEACSAEGHFPVQGKSLEEPVCRLMEGYGYRISDVSTFSSNEVYGGGLSWYRTWLSIELETEQEDSYQYIDINYDTATGELHQIEIFLSDRGTAAGVTGDMLELLAEKGAIPEGSEWIHDAETDLAIGFVQQEDFYYTYGTTMIDGYFYDNGCNVYISCEAEE